MLPGAVAQTYVGQGEFRLALMQDERPVYQFSTTQLVGEYRAETGTLRLLVKPGALGRDASASVQKVLREVLRADATPFIGLEQEGIWLDRNPGESETALTLTYQGKPQPILLRLTVATEGEQYRLSLRGKGTMAHLGLTLPATYQSSLSGAWRLSVDRLILTQR